MSWHLRGRTDTMLHRHTLGFLVATVALLQNAVCSSCNVVYYYVNQSAVTLDCECTNSCTTNNWTLNGAIIPWDSNHYSWSGSRLIMYFKSSVRLADEGTFVCAGTPFGFCNFSFVVLGTLQFVNLSQTVCTTPVLDMATMVMNAGPSQQVASTSFNLSVQHPSPVCCNQSAVLKPLPFFVTNTTYTLHNYNCSYVTCTYVATLQASPISTVTPSAVFKTFTVAITPTASILQPTPQPTLQDTLSLKVGISVGGILFLILLGTTVVVILFIWSKRSASSSVLRKRNSSVECHLDKSIELNIVARAVHSEKVQVV